MICYFAEVLGYIFLGFSGFLGLEIIRVDHGDSIKLQFIRGDPYDAPK